MTSPTSQPAARDAGARLDDQHEFTAHDLSWDRITIEELARLLASEHLGDRGLLGAVARRLDSLLKSIGE